jgi:hypothetical protein
MPRLPAEDDAYFAARLLGVSLLTQEPGILAAPVGLLGLAPEGGPVGRQGLGGLAQGGVDDRLGMQVLGL